MNAILSYLCEVPDGTFRPLISLQFVSLHFSVFLFFLSRLDTVKVYLRFCCFLYVFSKQAKYNLGLVNVLSKNRCLRPSRKIALTLP